MKVSIGQLKTNLSLYLRKKQARIETLSLKKERSQKESEFIKEEQGLIDTWATWTDVAENSETTFDVDKIDKYKCTVIDEESKHPILLYKVGKKISGNILDGKQHLEFPKP